LEEIASTARACGTAIIAAVMDRQLSWISINMDTCPVEFLILEYEQHIFDFASDSDFNRVLAANSFN
jgi:hypothetical protein